MDHREQRVLAREVFAGIPEMVAVVGNEDCCFDDIAEVAKQHREACLATVDQWPSEWCYRWACNIGDREVMRDRVTESEWCYYLARCIGDREIMRDRVTESKWCYWWARGIGDREFMRERITEPKWVALWNANIQEEHK